MNILLITADTLRADHMSCYGYWRLAQLSPLDDYPKHGLKYSRLWEVVAELYESEPRTQLFNSAQEPDELTDVAAEHPDVVEELSACLKSATESPFFYRGAEQ